MNLLKSIFSSGFQTSLAAFKRQDGQGSHVFLLLLAAGVVCPFPALAQTTFDRIDRQVETEQKSPESQPDRAVAPKVEQNIVVENDVSLVLKDLQLEGGSIYSRAQLEEEAYRYEGKTIMVSDVFKIAKRIESKYREDGYLFTRVIVPPQDVTGGTVRLQIIEGRVSKVIVEGNDSKNPVLKSMVASLELEGVLNVKNLESQMLKLNDLPGITAQSIIEPDPSSNGGLALRIVLSEDANRFTASFDNYGSKFIGPYQIGEKATLYTSGDYLSATRIAAFQATQLAELQYYTISHAVPIHTSGTLLTLSGSYTHTIPGYTLDPNNLKSISKTYGVELSQPLLRSRSKTISLQGGLEYRDSYSKVLGTRLYDDRLYVAYTGATLDFADSLKGLNLINANVRQGLDLFDVRESGSVDLSRAEGRTNFTSFQFRSARLQHITGNVYMNLSMKGQYAAKPLLSAEEFGFGGHDMGRAYNASEIVGDKGIAGSAEIYYNYNHGEKINVQPYMFYDIGKVWNNDRLTRTKESAASAGAGFRVEYAGISTNFVAAQPLTRSVDTPARGNDNGLQLKFSLQYDF